MRLASACLILTISWSASPFAARAAGGAWPRAAPADAGLDTAPLLKMEAAIRGGEFKRVGSVAIARHGKPVYEAYFDGDAATLCDTRSATKSLASALTGLAIFLLQPVGYPADGCRVPDIHRRPLGESLVEFPPRSAPIGR